ncbi:AEC family transporter [Planosporangium mesophilum]|uniref:Membrane protein n=1 Tax=Planosporangium mesophilum TaxID=689768 RepID=A0A8J3T7E9_9ACTN|nr:AEC family transporter [Planosporangium mesophilum]NJC81118.1 AEC family transporter [Planosporangium mesophilum]GII21234.1 membrane protein [Planosporangium mesophilum]
MIEAFVPIWALTLLGFLAGHLRLLGEGADRALGGFVFHLAMPAALFTVLARTRLSFSGPALVAFAGSTVVTMALGFVLSRQFFGRKPGEATVGAMASSYVNSANLGIPVAIQVLGDAAFLTGVLLFQVLVITPLVLTLLDRDADRGLRPARLATLPLRNPVILGLAAGTLCSALGWYPPPAIAGPLSLLGNAAVPAALVALGLSLTVRGPGAVGERTEVLWLSILKLLVQPLLAYLFGLLAQLRPADLLALVVCAALPTAQNAYIFAREYGQADSVARGTVIVSTALSMLTLASIGWLLG